MRSRDKQGFQKGSQKRQNTPFWKLQTAWRVPHLQLKKKATEQQKTEQPSLLGTHSTTNKLKGMQPHFLSVDLGYLT